MKIEIIAPGSEVLVGETVKGIVDVVSLKYPDYVVYNIVWWEGATRREGWFHPNEITNTRFASYREIGFQEKEPRA